jgi:hypothetical protein
MHQLPDDRFQVEFLDTAQPLRRTRFPDDRHHLALPFPSR